MKIDAISPRCVESVSRLVCCGPNRFFHSVYNFRVLDYHQIAHLVQMCYLPTVFCVYVLLLVWKIRVAWQNHACDRGMQKSDSPISASYPVLTW